MLSTPQNFLVGDLARTHDSVRQRIGAAAGAAGRDVHSITLLAVTKGQDVAAIRAAMSLGLTQFGENYIEEALPKIQAYMAARTMAFHAGCRQQDPAVASWFHGCMRGRLRVARGFPRSVRRMSNPERVRAGTRRRRPCKGGVEPVWLALLHQVNALPVCGARADVHAAA